MATGWVDQRLGGERLERLIPKGERCVYVEQLPEEFGFISIKHAIAIELCPLCYIDHVRDLPHILPAKSALSSIFFM